MSWIITGTEKLPSDSDAAAYIANVEAVDGQELEYDVRMAINTFVRGCKADGIWNAIKASCILAGARTLNGALVPLAGTAPTNYNFVSGDYNRKTGLVGDGSTKFLDSNRNNTEDPQNNKHLSVFRTVSETRSSTQCLIGNGTGAVGDSQLLVTASQRYFRINYSGVGTFLSDSTQVIGFTGASRNVSTSVISRYAGASNNFTDTSSSPISSNIRVFSRQSISYSDARIAFYSIGESLDLALLDARVTTLINAFSTAIP